MTHLRNAVVIVCLGVFCVSCGFSRYLHVPIFGGGGANIGGVETGDASWYGPGFYGKKTASGERFDKNKLTAAHRTLPFGTKVRVTRRDTGRSVVVRINDRGPFVRGRIIDLSKAAAKRIDLIGIGVAPVLIEVIR